MAPWTNPGRFTLHSGGLGAAQLYVRPAGETRVKTGSSVTDPRSLNRLALSATIHCLTGCGVGEVLGMVIGTVLGLDIGVGVLEQW